MLGHFREERVAVVAQGEYKSRLLMHQKWMQEEVLCLQVERDQV